MPGLPGVPCGTSARHVPRVAGALVLLVVVGVLVAALPATAAKPKGRSTTTTTGAAAKGCAKTSTATKTPVAPSGPSAETVVAQEGGKGTPRVELVRYPRPTGTGNPWSQWGQGLVLPDGRFLSAMGNHLGKDGNSYLFSYDPTTHTITRFADVRSEVGDALDWGYGKVHGQIVSGPCGDAFFATYWGTTKGMQYTPEYSGDVLFHVDGTTLELTSLGSLVPAHGIPSLAGSPKGDAVFGEAVDPAASTVGTASVHGTFFVVDPRTRKVVFRDDVTDHTGFRNVLVRANGRAYVAAQGGRLLEYVPGESALRTYPQAIPAGGVLRASTAPARDGTVYFATEKPDRFFAFRVDGTIERIADAAGYTTSMAVEPDGSAFYSVPGAHGTQASLGTPLVAVDPATGQSRTIVRLADLVRRELGLETAGSYDVALDAANRRVFVGLNVGQTADDSWGDVVLAVIELP